MRTRFSVVIPSRDAANLVACVEALYLGEPWLELEDVVVVDDGLDWNDKDLKSLAGLVDVLPGQKPFIFARNCNIGITRGRSRWNRAAQVTEHAVVLLNDDALLKTGGGLSLLAETASRYPEYGVIGATTNITGQPLQYRQAIGLREVPHCAFCCVLITHSALRSVGLLDERYALDYGCEDRDYCEAVARAGLKVGVHDGCFVDHGSLRSTFRGDPRTPKSFRQNFGLLLEKWGGKLVSERLQ